MHPIIEYQLQSPLLNIVQRFPVCAHSTLEDRLDNAQLSFSYINTSLGKMYSLREDLMRWY